MDRTLGGEARAILGAARAWIAEFSEEGVTSFEPAATAPAPEQAAHARERAPAATDEADARAARSAPANAPAPGAPAAGPTGRAAALEAVRQELGECTRCGLCEGRNRIVFGDGNPEATLMFVGEGPGEQEDRQGLPFVGRAGELLTRMIEGGLELPRRDVYICNIVKCRPPGNRNPLPDEVASCRPFLDGQIDAVRPNVLVALGKPATSLLLGRDVAITRVRGQWHEYRGIPVMPTFHPAFILRQYTAENRRMVWQDLKAALARSRE